MPIYFFPDTTVLINFTLIRSQEVLSQLIERGTGRWTLSVFRECQHSSSQPKLADLLAWEAVFGTPESPTPLELINAKTIATAMRKPGQDSQFAHMGEAETIAIAENRYRSAVLMTDDHDASRVAQSRGLQTVGTSRLIALADVLGLISTDQAIQHLQTLVRADRVFGGEPGLGTYRSFIERLRSSTGQ